MYNALDFAVNLLKNKGLVVVDTNNKRIIQPIFRDDEPDSYPVESEYIELQNNENSIKWLMVNGGVCSEIKKGGVQVTSYEGIHAVFVNTDKRLFDAVENELKKGKDMIIFSSELAGFGDFVNDDNEKEEQQNRDNVVFCEKEEEMLYSLDEAQTVADIFEEISDEDLEHLGRMLKEDRASQKEIADLGELIQHIFCCGIESICNKAVEATH